MQINKRSKNKKMKSTKYIHVRGAYNKFQAFFLQVFKIVVDSWKFSI